MLRRTHHPIIWLSISRPERIELANAGIDDKMCQLPDLKVLAAMAAANCGISSDLCHQSYRVGPAPNL